MKPSSADRNLPPTRTRVRMSYGSHSRITYYAWWCPVCTERGSFMAADGVYQLASEHECFALGNNRLRSMLSQTMDDLQAELLFGAARANTHTVIQGVTERLDDILMGNPIRPWPWQRSRHEQREQM